MASRETAPCLPASDRSNAPTILLVDDEAEILPEYQELLELEGFSAITTCDPCEVCTLVELYPSIALIVTDLKMAGLDGAHLIDLLRRTIGTSRQLSFIVMTGDASCDATQRLQGVPVLLKPIDLDQFMTAIRTALASPAPCT